MFGGCASTRERENYRRYSRYVNCVSRATETTGLTDDERNDLVRGCQSIYEVELRQARTEIR